MKRLPKVLRRLRRISVRQLSQSLPSLSQLLQRIRHRRYWDRHDLPKIARTGGAATEHPRPDFIIIGAPKCGTSWLQGALGQHPSIIMVPDEIEYFSVHLHYPVEWYFDHFTQRLASVKAALPASYALGEKSARYCAISPDRISLIRRLLPDARLILMTRDPVARHWSQAKRYFSKRRLSNQQGGVLTVPRSKLFDYFMTTRHLGEFSKMIANWTTVFPHRQLLIMSQERTLASPRAAFDAVLQHIGVSEGYDPGAIRFLTQQKNRGPKVEMPDDVAAFLEDMFVAERSRLRNLLANSAFAYARSEDAQE
jgi:hypothetical protein